jgi:hypothetical protein
MRKVEVGKSYKTRNGRQVRIHDWDIVIPRNETEGTEES